MVEVPIFLIHFMLLVLLLCSPCAFASFNQRAQLTQPKGRGELQAEYSFAQSADAFDGNGDKFSSFAAGFAGGAQRYLDHQLLLSARYGLTDKLSMGISLPILYREENNTLMASDSGIGDVRLWLLYSLLNIKALALEIGGHIEVKFPSGETSIGLVGTNATTNRQLPLGSGQTDLLLAIQTHQNFYWLQIKKEFGFRLRFNDQVDYLRAIQSDVDPVSGPFSQAVGNLSVNYGEELLANIQLLANLFDWLQLGGEADFRYFFRGSIDQFQIDLTNIVKTRANLSAGYLLTVAPMARIRILPPLQLTLKVELPLLGNDTPTVPIVESLIGLKFIGGLTYDF